MRERMRVYRRERPDAVRKTNREYVNRNREHVRANERQWRQARKAAQGDMSAHQPPAGASAGSER
jgi:hypothetical protein